MVNQGYSGSIRGLLGFAEVTLRLQVLLQDSMIMNFSTSEPHFVFKYLSLLILDKNSSAFSFQKKNTVCKFVTLFTSQAILVILENLVGIFLRALYLYNNVLYQLKNTKLELNLQR